jgi:hypothetical protein
VASLPLGVSCGAGAPGEGEATGSESDTGGAPPGLLTPADLCAGAPEVVAGRVHGTLRGAAEDGGGACGLGGPEAFLRAILPYRADLDLRADAVGFVPRVSVWPGACVEGRDLACGEGGAVTLTELPADVELLVVVGIDPSDPALDQGAPEAGPDPLDFSIDLVLTRILEEGETCVPSARGRCVAGTACRTSEDGFSRCAALAFDTCRDPQPLVLPAQIPDPVVVEIDPGDPHTDAHRHGCAGSDTRERVFRVDLSPDTGPLAELHVTVDDPAVSLALRSPGCGLADEVACAAAEPPTELVFPGAGAAAAAGERPFLFVELPDPPPEGEPADPIALRLDLVDG